MAPPAPSRRTVLLGASAVALAAPAAGQTTGPAPIAEVATFPGQVTGVAVAKDGRVFVNFPRWTEDAPVSVAEVGRDGALRPYPNAEWNAWRNANELDPATHFVCVQSVTVDPRGMLWIVDPAAPGNEKIVAGGPKLVQVDPSTDRVVVVIRFGEDAAPQGSYLNDVRVAPDGSFAYLTDSGSRGALVVVDLATGKARRVLDGHPSTQVEPEVKVRADGRELRRTDGRAPKFAADGIALSPDGATLYWQALTGRTLYRIDTASLRDPSLAPDALAAKVERAGETGVADGLWMDGRGRLYVTSPEDDSVKLRLPDGTMTTLAQDRRLRWPDSLAEGPDGSIYVTASRIMDASWFRPESGPRLPTSLWRIPPVR